MAALEAIPPAKKPGPSSQPLPKPHSEPQPPAPQRSGSDDNGAKPGTSDWWELSGPLNRWLKSSSPVETNQSDWWELSGPLGKLKDLWQQHGTQGG
jgi:hypothetical protein